MIYNITSIANTTSYLSFVQAVNTQIMNNWLGNLMLIAVFCVAFIAFMTANFELIRSGIGASFIVFVLAMTLRVISLVSDITILVTLLVLAFSIGISLFKT